VIDAIKPDVIALAHDETQWMLLVQEWSDACVVEAVSVYASNDGDWIVRERHPDDNAAATKVRAAWGCPAGNACCATLADTTLATTTLQVFELQVFEGGDSAEREHVLFVRLPRAFATKVVP
jgi:hypothetical protein